MIYTAGAKTKENVPKSTGTDTASASNVPPSFYSLSETQALPLVIVLSLSLHIITPSFLFPERLVCALRGSLAFRLLYYNSLCILPVSPTVSSHFLLPFVLVSYILAYMLKQGFLFPQ